MKRSNFIRNIENFICENCNESVIGNGYTNHCPQCLYSKHVDNEVPGDRGSLCGGIMKPIEYILKGETPYIVHKCELCGKISKNRTNESDSIDSLISIN